MASSTADQSEATTATRDPGVPHPGNGRSTPFHDGRRPQTARTVHCTTCGPRTLVPAPSIKRTLLSNPKGPRKGTCTGLHATCWWQPAGG